MYNTLYLSYDGMTDTLGRSQVIPYLQGVSQAGYKVSLISFEKEENESQRPFVKKLLEKSNIKWYPLSYTKKPPILSTLRDIRSLLKLVFQLHEKEGFKLVHCRSYISAFVGLSLKRKKNVPFLFDMRGFWADERIDGKIWNIKNPVFNLIYKYFKRKEKHFLKEADGVISLTNNGKDVMTTLFPEINIEKKTEVIPCCTDNDLFSDNNIDDALKAKFKTELEIKDSDFVLSYLGSIGTWYMLPEMLHFFSRLQQKKENALFLFITPDDPKIIYAEALKYGIERKKIKIIKARREEVPTLLSISQISIFFIKPVFSKKASSPTKQGELMSMGIPVICNSGVGDTDYVVEKFEAGYLLKDFTVEEYDTVIEKLDDILKLDKEKMKQGAIEFFSLNKGVENFLKTYENLID